MHTDVTKTTDVSKKFKEETKGFTVQEAIQEAKRCLRCKNPLCQKACPIENLIPDFIHEISKGNFGEARALLAQKTNLPAVCGRVCPHEKQCEGHCILGKKNQPIQVGRLERFVADFDGDMNLIQEQIQPKTRGKVAVIGSGPAGLTIAGDLSREGFQVTVFESENELGGVLMFGIPDYRLPKNIVQREIQRISSLGVNFMTNVTVGQGFTVDDIFAQGFDAIFIGTGTALSRDLKLPGRELYGIAQSIYFLHMVTLYIEGNVDRAEVPVHEGDEVLVIGAGNVGMDAARTAIRMGAKKVSVVYRKDEAQITALQSEYEGAVKEGVQFIWNADSIAFGGEDGKLRYLKVVQDGVEKEILADAILLAIGSKPANRIVSTTEGIEVSDSGYVITKEKPYGMTTLRGVFAGGDVVHQPATVVLAMKEAKKVALGIAAYVDAKKLLDM